MIRYLFARLNFHEQRWSYHLRKSDAPLMACLWLAAVCGLRLPWAVVPVYVGMSLLLNAIGKIVDHVEYQRTTLDYRDAVGDLFVIGMLAVPPLVWCASGSARYGMMMGVAWVIAYVALADLGWSNETELT
jgi:hypothetical protein